MSYDEKEQGSLDDLLKDVEDIDIDSSVSFIDSANAMSKKMEVSSKATAPHDAAYMKKPARVDEETAALLSNLQDYTSTNLTRKLVPYMDIKINHSSEVFCLRWSPDGQYLAAGCNGGFVRIYNIKGNQAYEFNCSPALGLPTTCIRFRPNNENTKTKNVVLTANADGDLQHWHMTSGKKLYSIHEENNQVYCIDFHPDGSSFAAGGKDCKVRIYEENTKQCVVELGSSDYMMSPGHSNRIFSVKFKQDDPNIVISGGWDNTVQVWDVRAGKSVKSIYGPHICGDSLDVNSRGQILSGSWRPENALQLWDLGTGKLFRDIEWVTGMGGVSTAENAMLYTAQFSADGSLIAAGGTGTRDVRVFDTTADYQLMGRIRVGQHGIYTLDFAGNKRIAIGGNTDTVAVRDIVSPDEK